VHAPAEIDTLATADVEALASWPGDKPFFMGAAPTRVDATVHAFVCNCLGGPFQGALKEAARRHANLVACNERLLQRVFPEHATARAA
jgi:glutathione S-transferase